MILASNVYIYFIYSFQTLCDTIQNLYSAVDSNFNFYEIHA